MNLLALDSCVACCEEAETLAEIDGQLYCPDCLDGMYGCDESGDVEFDANGNPLDD